MKLQSAACAVALSLGTAHAISPLVITTTAPADGSSVATGPTTFIVTTSEPIAPASLNSTDFLVNGIPADGWSLTVNQITFGYVISPVTSQGVQSMVVPLGAFSRASDGFPVQAFSGSFRYDVLALAVTSTVPPPGGAFTLPGPFTFDLTFNEPVDPGSVAPGDLALSGLVGAFVDSVTLLPGNTTARFTLAGIVSPGDLTASLAAGDVTDVYGNPGTAFSARYEVTASNVPEPGTCAAGAALGGLVGLTVWRRSRR